MSLELDMADPWNRLQFAYENCRVKQFVDGHYAKYDDGKLSMCGIGWALHCAGYTDDELKPDLNCAIKTFTHPTNVCSAMKEFGFKKEERRKFRNCPQPDCVYQGSLQRVLEHLNEAHRIPIPYIGKLLPVIRKEEKKNYTLMDHLKILKQDFRQFVTSR